MADNVWEQDYAVLDAAVTYFTFTSPQGPVNADEISRVLADVSEHWDVSVTRLYNASPPFLVPDERWAALEVAEVDLAEVAPPSGATERGLRATGAWPPKRETGAGYVGAW